MISKPTTGNRRPRKHAAGQAIERVGDAAHAGVIAAVFAKLLPIATLFLSAIWYCLQIIGWLTKNRTLTRRWRRKLGMTKVARRTKKCASR